MPQELFCAIWCYTKIAKLSDESRTSSAESFAVSRIKDQYELGFERAANLQQRRPDCSIIDEACHFGGMHLAI